VDAELRARIAEAVARRFGEETEPPEIDRGAETLARLLGRASCRKFRPDPVEPALLQLVCAAALSAPTKSDLQQADILNVTDPALRAQIAALVPTMPRVREAPAFLVFLANGRRIRQVAELRRKPFANDHLDAFFNAAVDAAIVLGTFTVAAEAVGLGTCAISVIGDRIFELAELLGLPEPVVPVAGMCVGWPAHVPPPHPRLPLGLTLHENRFDDGRLAGWWKRTTAGARPSIPVRASAASSASARRNATAGRRRRRGTMPSRSGWTSAASSERSASGSTDPRGGRDVTGCRRPRA
jgi:nitroreductase/FMN reductase [NAD(P)H]